MHIEYSDYCINILGKDGVLFQYHMCSKFVDIVDFNFNPIPASFYHRRLNEDSLAVLLTSLGVSFDDSGSFIKVEREEIENNIDKIATYLALNGCI